MDWLSSSLCLLCHQMEEMDTEIGQNILTGKAGPKRGVWGLVARKRSRPVNCLAAVGSLCPLKEGRRVVELKSSSVT